MPDEIYHVGLLGRDRQLDAHLDYIAERYLVKGTEKGRPTRGGDPHRNIPRGTGEGFLTQRKIKPYVYEYGFTRTKNGTGTTKG